MVESQQDTATAWEELWEELHHQGDVGDASYAAVPELVRIHRNGGAVDWNLYAIMAIIELARTEPQNPEVPDWLSEDYFRSIQELARMGTKAQTADVTWYRIVVEVASNDRLERATFSGTHTTGFRERWAGELRFSR